ncbi:MAG: transcriptional regulator, Crp/Fnr family [Caulobacteraceae bacterium]|nr:transcriptional regulator, Crp/Fnr family [Caulobacteraceae bacterium]
MLPRPFESLMSMPHRNLILAALQPAERARLLESAVRRELIVGDVAFSPEAVISMVVFPEVGVISLITECADGTVAEAGIVGPEGAAGLTEALGSGEAATRGVVQANGTAWYVSAGRCRALHEESSGFRRAAALAAEFQAVETRQSVLCRSHHSTQARLARWLLEMADRSKAEKRVLTLTQESLALMLGVQRTTVTMVAHQLKAAGLIRYARGTIELRDEAALEIMACECRSALQSQFHRIYAAREAEVSAVVKPDFPAHVPAEWPAP